MADAPRVGTAHSLQGSTILSIFPQDSCEASTLQCLPLSDEGTGGSMSNLSDLADSP